MNPTQAKFHDDLDAIASQLDLGVRSGKYSWSDVQQLVKDRSADVAAQTDRYVHEHTWTSLALAAGLGLVVGLLIGE